MMQLHWTTRSSSMAETDWAIPSSSPELLSPTEPSSSTELLSPTVPSSSTELLKSDRKCLCSPPKNCDYAPAWEAVTTPKGASGAASGARTLIQQR